jgi:hypothetical protein
VPISCASKWPEPQAQTSPESDIRTCPKSVFSPHLGNRIRVLQLLTSLKEKRVTKRVASMVRCFTSLFISSRWSANDGRCPLTFDSSEPDFFCDPASFFPRFPLYQVEPVVFPGSAGTSTP